MYPDIIFFKLNYVSYYNTVSLQIMFKILLLSEAPDLQMALQSGELASNSPQQNGNIVRPPAPPPLDPSPDDSGGIITYILCLTNPEY